MEEPGYQLEASVKQIQMAGDVRQGIEQNKLILINITILLGTGLITRINEPMLKDPKI